MWKPFGKHIVILGIILLGTFKFSLGAVPGFTKEFKAQETIQLGTSELTIPQLHFSAPIEVKNETLLFVEDWQEEADEENEDRKSPDGISQLLDFAAVLPANFTWNLSVLYQNHEKSTPVQEDFSGITRCHYLLFRVFRI